MARPFCILEFELPGNRFTPCLSKQHDIEALEDELSGGDERIRRSHSDRQRKKVIKHRERESREQLTDNVNTIEGRILSTESAYFNVQTESGNYKARTIKSTVSGNPLSTLAAVGDRVALEVGTAEEAVIREVFKRKTKLARKAHKRKAEFEQVIAANVDRLLITSSVKEPPFYSHIVDRYIVAGLEGELEVNIIVNKFDLLEEDPFAPEIERRLAYYDSIGYRVFRTSTRKGEGINELRDSLAGVTAVLAGRSGVGKSSIINALVGQELLRTSELTKKVKRGAHTTTGTTLLPLSGVRGAYLVDTPGIREFFNYDLDADNLKFRYKEFLNIQQECNMTNCMHIHEPGCAVIDAVERGMIPEWRYSSYEMLYREASHS